MKHLKTTSIFVFVFVVIVHLLLIMKLVTSDKLVATKKETVQKIDLRNVTLVSKPKVQVKKKIKLKPKKKPKPKKKIKPKPKPKPKKRVKPIAKPKPVLKPEPEPQEEPQKEVKEVKPSKPVVAKPKLSATQAEIIKSQYIQEIKNAIEEKKYYPRRARKLHHEGTVSVRFTILKDGTIKDISLENPSRFKRLNSGALKTLQSIGKFSPIPKELNLDDWEIVVPIEYILK